MTGLLIKDLKLLGKQKQTLIIVVALVAFFVYTSMNTSFVSAYMAGLTMITGLGTLSYDSADHGYMFLFSLPITRKQYVLEKYALVGIMLGIICVINQVIIVIPNIVRHQGDLAECIQTSVITLLVVFVVAWVMIPVQLKYGAEKLRTVLAIMGGCIFAGVFIVAKVLEMLDIDLDMMMASLPESTPMMVIGVLIVVAGIATVISMKMSIAIMEHKEF